MSPRESTYRLVYTLHARYIVAVLHGNLQAVLYSSVKCDLMFSETKCRGRHGRKKGSKKHFEAQKNAVMFCISGEDWSVS
jgi:hypothetical protein